MPVRHLYIPMRASDAPRHGRSERELRRRLEKDGWLVWRGELVGILRSGAELYPNVRRKYETLEERFVAAYGAGLLERLQYLAAVHHGVPDFLCYRGGEFKFVECKLGHERLSKSQRRTIPLLQSLGLRVEVHKLVEPCTKTREALIDVETGKKSVVSAQRRLTLRPRARPARA